jgi:hypothetical protein
MSQIAVTHHRHLHIPWLTIIAVAVAVAAAATVLVLVNQPATTSVESAQVVPVPAAEAAAVPLPESPALRHRLAAELAAVAQSEPFAYPRNHVIGVTLSPATNGVVGAHLATGVAPNDPHPFNHFPGEP